MALEYLEFQPDYGIIASEGHLSDLPTYAQPFWDDFFKDHFRYAKHKDVQSGGDKNYFIFLFKEEFAKFQSEVLENASYKADLETNDGSLNFENAKSEALSAWNAFLIQTDKDFILRSKNVLLWAFELLKNTMVILEDFVISRSIGVQIPIKAVEQSTEVLANDERAQFQIPGTHGPELAKNINEGSRDPTWETAHINSNVKVFRDQIRTHRHNNQQKIGELAAAGAHLNTAITDHATLLKAISTLSGSLIRSVISKR